MSFDGLAESGGQDPVEVVDAARVQAPAVGLLLGPP